MRTNSKTRLIGTVGVIVGLLAVASGSAVLLGINQPEYAVLLWLVIYNSGMGLVSIAAGTGIWMNRAWANRLSGIIAVSHTGILVVLILFTIFSIPVAMASIGAMTFRAVVWIGITLFVERDEQYKPFHV